MPGDTELTTPGLPTLEEMQHWTWVVGRAQQMMLEHAATMAQQTPIDMSAFADPAAFQSRLPAWMGSMPQAMLDAQADMWRDGMTLWQGFIGAMTPPARCSR